MDLIINMNKIKNNNKMKIKDKFNNIRKLRNINSLSNLPDLTSRNTSKQNWNNIFNKTLKIQASSPINLLKNNNTNKFQFYSPKTFSKFNKINPLSPLNYFQKYNFLFKKNNTFMNLHIKNNNSSKILKNDNPENKSKYISSFDNTKYNTTQRLKKNFSSYFYKSQSSLYSSKRIFHHYIHESENDKITPEKYFYNGGAPKHKKELDKLNTLNLNYYKRINEIKYNNSIAYKKDFNILSYQATLLKILSKKVSDKNVKDLQKKYINFNQKIFGLGVGPRGRFTNLAEKIKYNVPVFLYERIRNLDKEKLMSRYNNFKKAYENMHNNFEKMYNKTHKKSFKKKQENDSSKENKYIKDDIYKLKNKNKNKNKSNNKYNFNYSF